MAISIRGSSSTCKQLPDLVHSASRETVSIVKFINVHRYLDQLQHGTPSNLQRPTSQPSSFFADNSLVKPTAADIRRKNASFAARAQAGKRTSRPARSGQKRSAGTWVLIGMGFLLVGGSEFEATHIYEMYSSRSGADAVGMIDYTAVVELARLVFFGTL